jgi:signal peptidase I
MSSLDPVLREAGTVKCELAAAVLRSSGRLRLGVMGWSMFPSVQPGDILIAERAVGDAVTEGDIVLFSRDRRLFAHRVVGRKNGAQGPIVLTRGDTMAADDAPVNEDELLGRVSLVVRDGMCFEPRKNLRLRDRAVAALVKRSQIAARVVVGIHGLRHASPLRAI